ncbi:MAG TPA: hypothetical protein VJL29_15500 [Thermoguttaceae bacterium]|nr:hypothetical protein [Thermoguttaceae bacterium]
MVAVWLLLGVYCFGFGLAVSVVAADTAVAPFAPLGPAQLEKAVTGVRLAAQALETRLFQDGENGRNWRAYLKLDQLTQELNRPGQPDLKRLDEVYTRLDRDYDGLDLVWFADLKLALGRYLNVARAIGNPQIEAAYKTLVEKTLPEQLAAYNTAPLPAAAHDIGVELGWLSDFRQAEDFVRHARKNLVRPNLYFEVSRDFVAAGMERPIDETTPICDVILGTNIQGTGQTKGQIAIEFVPCDTQAVIKILMSGTTHSNNVGRNGPVCIYSTGATTFEGSKQLAVTADGLEASPAASSATTSTTITGIGAKRQFIEKAAWRRVCKQKCTAEAIASRHAECRVNRRMDEQGGEAAADANRRYEERVRGPLGERRIFAEKLICATTDSKIKVRALRAGYDQLAAWSCPPKPAVPADVVVRVHQSAVNNSAATLLAGRVVTEEDFLKTVKDVLGEVPKELQPEEGKAPWTIHFADREPFVVTFDNEGYTVSLHAVGFVREGTTHPGMDITATYKIENTDKGLVAARQGELAVYPPGFVKGRRQLSGPEQTVREMLKKRFEKVFDEKVVPRGYLELKGRWEKIGRAPLVQWSTADGWMTVAWKLGD